MAISFQPQKVKPKNKIKKELNMLVEWLLSDGM